MKENYEATLNYIRELIKESNIIDNDEKWFWLDILEELTEDQFLKLANILILDKKEQIIEFSKIILSEYGTK
jgi:hypothetical protein